MSAAPDPTPATAPADRPARRLDGLLQPLGTERFFAEGFGRRTLHLQGTAARVADVMTLAELNRLLNMTTVWTPRTLQIVIDRRAVVAEEYCRPARDTEGLRPVPALVTEWLRRGASLVLNNISELNDGMAEIAAGLRAATGAGVQANLYFSRRGRQAFAPHYDTHEVFALHCHGEKRWRIFANRADAPTQRSQAVDRDLGHKRPEGERMHEVTLRPGDLLYLPRGQFHDALASSEATIHVSFAVSMPIGVDLLRFLADEGVLDGALRRDLPRGLAPDALAAAAGRVGERLGAMTRDPRFLDALRRHLLARAPAFDRYDLAAALAAPVRYRPARDGGTTLRREGDGLVAEGRFGRRPIPPRLHPVVQWAAARQAPFARDDVAGAFPGLTDPQVDQAIESLLNLAVVELA
ncbi:MAG: cupin-like domain-containing protein [Alphaproteobacteria bacterium]|nr:cupin-like domain-containing protein [Alphaproteobacteria bacterium]